MLSGLIMLYICTKFKENIFFHFKVIERKKNSLLKITKGHKSVKSVGRVANIYLCILSGHALHFPY